MKQNAKTKEKDECATCSRCNLSLPRRRNFAADSTMCTSCERSWNTWVASRTNVDNDDKCCNPLMMAGISLMEKKGEKSHRECRRCNRYMPLDKNFEPNNSKSTHGKIFRKWTCMSCRAVTKFQLRRIKKLLRMEDYYGTKCPICCRVMHGHGSVRAVPDHCHLSGNFRGVICNDCNTSIGKLNDDPKTLMRAVSYLLRSPGLI